MTEKINEVVYVDVEEWTGLYINGKLAAEGGGIHLADELNGMTMTFTHRSYIPSDDIHVMEFGGFPQNLVDLLKFADQ